MSATDIKIKICGIRRPQDAEMVVSKGVTHVGCVMIADSPRRVSVAEAQEIFAAAGPQTSCVLVFRAESASTIAETAAAVGTKHIQVSSATEEELALLEKEGFTVYRVHEVPTGTNLLPPLVPAPSPDHPAILTVLGGTAGITFPWEILGTEAPSGTFIGGGVRQENVCALLTHNPYGMNICPGLERRPGVMDADRLDLLFETLSEGI